MQNILGERSEAEKAYDDEVLRYLCVGYDIQAAIALANQKYPSEALVIDDSNLADVATHYEFLAEHYELYLKLPRMT
jgi:hypothetical protein